MISTKVKALVVVFALLLSISIITVGCRNKSETGLIKRASLSGTTLGNYANKPKHNPNIVYLGSDNDTSGVDFGPKDVSFEFRALR